MGKPSKTRVIQQVGSHVSPAWQKHRLTVLPAGSARHVEFPSQSNWAPQTAPGQYPLDLHPGLGQRLTGSLVSRLTKLMYAQQPASLTQIEYDVMDPPARNVQHIGAAPHARRACCSRQGGVELDSLVDEVRRDARVGEQARKLDHEPLALRVDGGDRDRYSSGNTTARRRRAAVGGIS
ncbi:hypothetical protein NL676_037101 [Syzygium grande]|nr:hypothetical protein NL676_037101 [Syzygium grande]